MYCQLVEICGCIPARIRHALADLPETLDETYERTLREIGKANWEFAHRLFQFVAVAVRPLRVEELAELLAFDFKAGLIPKFHEDWRLQDPMDAILSTCPSFFAIVDDKNNHSHRKVVQFSHFSVKEYLTSARLAEATDVNFRRYHISETPAHTLAARACLGYFLHLDKDVTSEDLLKLPFIDYAEYWVDHARLEDVARNVESGLKELFDPSKPYLALCIWICDPGFSSWQRGPRRSERPSSLRGTPLHYATLWDLHSIVELLINELSQDVNSQDFTDSDTPLHVASSDGHIKIARRLHECGADLKALNKDSETPLHVASKRGQLEVSRMLVERGADVTVQDKEGKTPLHLASQAGRPEVVRMLIEHDAVVSAQNKDDQTPLHLASQAGRLEVASVLIERGAGVSAPDKDGQSPLHLAAQAGRLEFARMLINRGAGVSAQNKDGQTPLHLVLDTSSHPEVACMLIECGAGVSAQDKDGQSPLHLALQARQLEVSRMLIVRGAGVSAQNNDGQTPLHLASQAGVLEAARMLIVRGAWLSAQNKEGQTPLHLASQAGRVEVARLLIVRRAAVSAQNNDGQTPLHLASQAGKWEVARMLINRGAGVSTQNKDGQTPLHLVFLGNWVPNYGTSDPQEIARMLIERGADVSAQDKDGRTPRQLASQAGQREFIRMLVRGEDTSA